MGLCIAIPGDGVAGVTCTSRTSRVILHASRITLHASRITHHSSQAGSVILSFFISGPASCTGAIIAAVEFKQMFPGGPGSVIDVEVSTFALRRCWLGEYTQTSPAICFECPSGSFTLSTHLPCTPCPQGGVCGGREDLRALQGEDAVCA